LPGPQFRSTDSRGAMKMHAMNTVGAGGRQLIPFAWMALGLGVLLGAGCRREEVKVYEVTKSPESPASAVASPHGGMTPGAAAGMAGHPHGDLAGPKPRIEYTVPEGWTEQPASAMRAASFIVGDPHAEHADLGVIPLRGLTGRTLEMWNLWRQQLGLPEGSAEEMTRAATPVTVDGHEGRLFELTTAEPPPGESRKIRILGAMVDVGDVAWFFKMTGPDEFVGSQKSAFLNWLGSVKFVPESEAGAVAEGGAGGGLPSWEVPSGWQPAPPGQFLAAKFVAGEGDQQVEINISQSAGEGGGWIANVNRWRRQLGLVEAGADEIREQTVSLQLAGGQGMQIELAGTDVRKGAPAHVVGVMVPLGDRTWFYKLTGPPEAVKAQKEAFLGFVRSARY